METILELREELGNLIIEYDKKLRDNLKIEAFYNAELGDKINELSVYEAQIIICREALKMDEKDLELDEIITNVNKIKEEVERGLANYQNKRKDFKAVIENVNKYTDAQIKKLDEEYANFVKKHHSALILYIPEPHDKACRYLRSCYLLNDYNDFMSFTHQEALLDVKDITYTETQTEEVYISKYKEFIEGYKRELQKLGAYDEKIAGMKMVIEDDMLLARNETELRSRIYKAKDDVVQIVAHCKDLFPKEVEFEL